MRQKISLTIEQVVNLNIQVNVIVLKIRDSYIF